MPRRVRLKPKRLTNFLRGSLEISETAQSRAKIVVRLGKVRCKFNGKLTVLQRLSVFARFAQQKAKIIVSSCIVWIKGNGAAIAFTCLSDKASRALRVPKVAIYGRQIWNNEERLPNKSYGVLGPSLRKRDQAQHMECISVARVSL